MIRWLFLIAFVLVLELVTWLVAKGVFWLVKPYLPHSRTLVMISAFVLSNLMVATLFMGQFRLGMGYFALLWMMLLSMSVTVVIVHVSRHLGQTELADGIGIRLLSVASFMGLIGLALYNAYTPVVRHLSIVLDKPIAHSVRFAVASDLHLGTLFGSKHLYKLADILAEQQVDMLLMPGDIMDDDTHIYNKQQMQTAFKAVVAATKSGVVASLGNHDLYNQNERYAIAQAIMATGTTLLNDQVTTVVINNTPFTIIGRFDDHAKNRLSTAELLRGINTDHPVILLDHRPSQIQTNTKLPIDLQVSGHTHNGQIFPANFIIKAINRLGYGYEKINNTHVVVSSGYGFWGVPFRLASQSEIWVITVVGNHTTP